MSVFFHVSFVLSWCDKNSWQGTAIETTIVGHSFTPRVNFTWQFITNSAFGLLQVWEISYAVSRILVNPSKNSLIVGVSSFHSKPRLNPLSVVAIQLNDVSSFLFLLSIIPISYSRRTLPLPSQNWCGYWSTKKTFTGKWHGLLSPIPSSIPIIRCYLWKPTASSSDW